MRGIDVSSWQAVRDWGAVRAAGYDFAIVKCTGGRFYLNPSYAAQITGARAAGLLVGHYHYGYEGEAFGDPEAEARRFFAAADIRPGEPLVLDIEEPKAWDGVLAFVVRFLVELERLCGFPPVLYSYQSYLIERGLTDARLARYALWFASYPQTAAPGPFPATPQPWREITIWQWSAFATVPGIGPNVDDNITRLDADGFRALGGAVASPPTARFENPDPATGVWVHEFFGHVYELAKHGRPLLPAALYADGYVRQVFENLCLGSNGRGEPKVEGLGQALAHMTSGRYPEWPGVGPLLP